MTLLPSRNRVVRFFLITALFLSTASFSQTILNLGLFNVDGSPACASSANSQGLIICVVSASGSLVAAAVKVPPGTTGTTAVISGVVPMTLNLGTGGSVRNSSCASTADSSGDVVCAITNGGVLTGIRFNVANRKIYPLQNLGLPDVDGNASCFNANDRFSVAGPPTTEGPEGATICAVRGGANILRQVAFNPASGYLAVANVDSPPELLRFDPGCVRAPDATNEVICAWANFNQGSGIQAGAIDPRISFVSSQPFPLFFTGQQFFVGTPGCANPVDNSGMVLCLATDITGAALGFALDPRTGAAFQVNLSGKSGISPYFDFSPSCASAGGKGGPTQGQIICAALEGAFNTLDAYRFDPRTGEVHFLQFGQAPPIVGNASCTFENINPGQVSCGIIDGTNHNRLEIVLLLP